MRTLASVLAFRLKMDEKIHRLDSNSGYNYNRFNMAKRFSILIILFIFLFVSLPVPIAKALVAVDDFIVSPLGSAILIEWWTGNETNNTGFYLQRSQAVTGGYQRITSFIQTDWDGFQTAYYYFFDEEVVQDVIYYYRIEAVDQQGVSTFFGPAPGSTSQMLPTFVPSFSPTPARSSTPTLGVPITVISPSATPSIAGSTTIATTPANPTASVPTLTSGAPSQTGTPGTPVIVSPTVTKTLEPLPTIILTFPASPTSTPVAVAENRNEPQVLTPTVPPGKAFVEKPPIRLLSLGILVAIIWLFLGAFLVFMVRQFRD